MNQRKAETVSEDSYQNADSRRSGVPPCECGGLGRGVEPPSASTAKRIKDTRARAGQFGFPALPPSSEILTPSRIEALRRRARHAHRNALAFRGIGEIELAAIYQQCADDIAARLGESA